MSTNPNDPTNPSEPDPRSTAVFRPIPKDFFEVTQEERDEWTYEFLRALWASGQRSKRTPPPPPPGLFTRIRRRLRRRSRRT